MIQIIDKRCTGKTSRLMLLAKENNGIVVCNRPEIYREKALRYGLVGISFISYDQYIRHQYNNPDNSPIYVDEIDGLLSWIDRNSAGYTVSLEEKRR